MNDNLRNKFKRIDPVAEEKKQKDAIAANNTQKLSLTNGKLPVLPLAIAGVRYLRLLPQPQESEDTYCHMVPYLYITEKEIPRTRGYMALTHKQAEFLSMAVDMFRSNPQFKDLLRTQNNPSGISLYPKYRELFLGFNAKDPEKKLYIIVLPSNGYTPNPSQIQAGTKIKQFPFERYESGELKYGDIFDVENGNLIKIETMGESDRTSYHPSVDRKFPLTDPEFEQVLDEVVPFSELISYATQKQFLIFLRSVLTDAMFTYLMTETGAESKMRGKVITEEEWQEVLAIPSNKIGYTSHPASRQNQYNPAKAKPAPQFKKAAEAQPQTAPANTANEEDDEEDDIPYGDAPAKPEDVPAKAEAAPQDDGVTDMQRNTRKCIEEMRKNGVPDTAIPAQLFVQAGWEVPTQA